MGGCLLVPTDGGGRLQVALDYRQSYLMAGMATKGLEVHANMGSLSTVAARYSHFGDADYNEQQMSLAYGLHVNRWLQLGVAGRYLYSGTADAWYQPEHYLAAALIARAILGNRCEIALLAGTRPWDEARPWRWHASLGYRPVEGLLAVVEAESEECMRARLGLEYCYEKLFFIRSGLATNPLTLSFGLGWRQQHYSIDLATEVHSALGLTPQVTLSVCL